MPIRVLKVAACLFLALASMNSTPVSLQAADDPLLEQYFIANAAYNRKLYPVAIQQYKSFLQKNAAHPKADLARRGLALSLYAMRLYDKAMPEFAALLAKPSLDKSINRERLIMLQSQCMLNSGKRVESRKLFIEQLKHLKTPSYKSAAIAAICDISFEKKEWDMVIQWTAKLMLASPTASQSARGLYQQGLAFYQTEKTKEAIGALIKVTALPEHDEWKTRASYLLGECHTLLNELDKAEPAFAAALPGMTNNDGAECQYRLGFTRFLLKKYEPAIPDFEAYLKRAKPDKGKPAPYINDAKFYIARCYIELKDYGKANKKFSELAGGEGLFAAKSNLWWARVFSRQGNNFERAAQILGEYLKRLGNKAKASPLIDDLQFEYANALIGSKTPD